MKSKADPDDGWFKVADDLAQALARTSLPGQEATVCFWALATIYGRKIKEGKIVTANKEVALRYHRVAYDTGLDRRCVRRAVQALIEKRVLRVTRKGMIGFNTRVSEWPLRGHSFRMGIGPKPGAQEPRGHTAPGPHSPLIDTCTPPLGGPYSPGADTCTPPQTSDGAPNARAIRRDVGEVERGRVAAGAAHPPSLHPGTAADTLRKRAQLADDRWPLEEHPAWRTASYELQAELREEWAVQENIRDTAKAKAQVQRAADEQARGEKKAVSPERARAIVDEFRSKHGGKT